MITDELSIDYENPATDPLGYEHVQGKLRCKFDLIELQFHQIDRAFRKIPVVIREIPYAQVESATYVDRWFRPKLLIFKTKDPQHLAGFPGGEVGKIKLQVSRSSRDDAKRMAALLQYKQSEALADETAARMNHARAALE